MPSKKWTQETCREAAQKFSKLKDFRGNYPGAYSVAKRNNWIKDYTWLSIGKNAGYWDYEHCLEEAKKFKTKIEFEKGSPSAYSRSKKEGWIKNYTWFEDGRLIESEKRRIWNYDSCYDLAKSCKMKSEMNKKSNAAYRAAKKNNWIKDYTWFLSDEEIRHQKRPSRVKWPYEKCKEIALTCKTLKEFREKSSDSAYTIARRNGWLDEFDWLERLENPFTDKRDNVYAYTFEDLNSVYVGRTVDPKSRDLEHRKSDKSAVFKFAFENNIEVPKMTILETGLTLLEGLKQEDHYKNKYKQEGWNILNIAKTGIKSGSLGSLKRKWTKDECYKEAKKYSTLKDFRKKSPTAYNVSLKNNWDKEYTWLVTTKTPAGYWNYDHCFEEAKKYKTRKQFCKGNHSAYDSALKHKWLDDYTWFDPPKFVPLSYEDCYRLAKKCTKLSDFTKNCGGAYYKAKKEGWIDDYTWLEKTDISQKPVLQYSLSGIFLKKYKGVREACRENNFKTNSGISECCTGKLRFHKGYIWCYEGDENTINERIKTFVFKYDSKYSLIEVIPKKTSHLSKYIDTGKLAPDGYYYYHGPHKFTDDDEQNKNQDLET